VSELSKLPKADIRAMAVYLASLNGEAVAQVQVATTVPNPNGRRVFEGSCKACHADGLGPKLFGVSPSLATNTNVFSDQPDNLIKVILQGISKPATRDLGYMPGFKDSLSDSQVADLAEYLRGQFAPNAPQWKGLAQRVAHLRANPGTH
jgi:nicotinate dehydrogenase subunit B